MYISWKFRSGYCRPFGHKSFSFRSHKNFCVDSFVHHLSLLPWNAIEIFDNVNDALEQSYKLFNATLDKHAPIKQHRVKRLVKPDWFIDEINTAIKLQDVRNIASMMREAIKKFCFFFVYLVLIESCLKCTKYAMKINSLIRPQALSNIRIYL